jgi:membrane protein DedA with SNARE-associated domain
LDIRAFVETYGYLAVFAGTLLEGETVLLAAGFAAHQGLLDWRLVMAVALIGGTLGDQLAFLLGRWKGEALIARFPILAGAAPRVHRLVERFDVGLILTIRFIYGLRIAGPVIMGSSRIPLYRFSVFNMIGAAIWAVLVGGAGYLFGMAIESMFGRFQHVELIALAVIFAVGFLLWLGHHLVNRKH